MKYKVVLDFNMDKLNEKSLKSFKDTLIYLIDPNIIIEMINSKECDFRVVSISPKKCK